MDTTPTSAAAGGRSVWLCLFMLLLLLQLLLLRTEEVPFRSKGALAWTPPITTTTPARISRRRASAEYATAASIPRMVVHHQHQIAPTPSTANGCRRRSAAVLLQSHTAWPSFGVWNNPRQQQHPSIHSNNSPPMAATSTRLHSLQGFIDQVVSDDPAVASIQSNPLQQPLTIFVGGKGGVGKTTVSSALAVQLASALSSPTTTTSPKKVLIVSTDPAHSLGDALDVNLKGGTTTTRSGEIVRLEYNAVTEDRLYAQEIDASAALDELRQNLAAFDIQSLAQSLVVPVEVLESLGVSDLTGLLNNPPPGLDELVALANIFSNNKNNHSSSDGHPFDVVVVDTAPTGHTLRLLALPQFLDGLLGKLIQLRVKLSKLASTLQSLVGSNSGSDSAQQAQQRAQTMDAAMQKLVDFQTKMMTLRSNLQNPQTTRFLVVTVPTILGVAETERLVAELQRQSIAVTDIVVNQCIFAGTNDVTTAPPSPTMANNYYNRRVAQQQKWIEQLTRTAQQVSESQEYQQNKGDDNNDDGSSTPSSSSSIAMTLVPYFDVELVGIPALGYVGSQIFVDNPNFQYLLQPASTQHDKDKSSSGKKPRVVICGGKGGVGKTTTSAALAISMAATGGHKVALISTDPAHSLGDAVTMNLNGGALQECSLVGVPGYTGEEGGSLSVLEIDPSASLAQFKGLVDQLMGGGSGGTLSAEEADSSGGFRDALKDLQQVFDTLPAGTDEVVALAKIVNLVNKGGFDRIVLDTAPTGHTLRMLSTPGFLSDLIDRLLRISDKINSNFMVKMFIGGSSRRDEINAAVETSKSTLLSFQFQMYDLEDLFADAENTEFLIVTVPTELAVRESTRLLNDLTFEAPDMPIKVRNVVVNQVLKNESENDAQTFLAHLESTQQTSIAKLERFAKSIPTTSSSSSSTSIAITTVPYLDTEPRGVFGLKALAAELIKED